MAAADPRVHRRYLDYREAYVYFARGEPRMTYDAFALLDAELAGLDAMAELDDEQETRREELRALLYRD